jgi:hypothetical protein
MKKNIALCFVLLFTMPFMHSMNDSRSFMNRFLAQLNKGDEFITNNIMLPHLNPQLHEDASEEYQKLGKQAQDQLHISPLDQRPIKNMKNIHRNSAGIATASAIFINEDYLNKHSVIIKKYGLLHEAAHVKHRDSLKTKLLILGTVAFNGGMLLSSELSSSNIAVFGAVNGLFVLMSNYLNGSESRADKAALHALNCYKCVDEVKKVVGADRDASILAQGYWGPEQMQSVIDKFKQQNKVCPDHEKQVADSGSVIQKIRTWVSGR